MKLSNNFSLSEMTDSQTATRKGIKEQFTPPQQVINNLEDLCINILQPLRDELCSTITISSGYRCEKLNKAIGGASSSQHVKGQAADITNPNGQNKVLWDKIIELKLPFDQMIYEGDKGDGDCAWVHVSYNEGKNRGEKLKATFKKGKATYEKVN